MNTIEYIFLTFIICFFIYCFIHALINHNKEEREIAATREKLKAQEGEFETKRIKLENDKKQFEKKKEFYDKEIANIENVIKEKCAIYPRLAGVMADMLTLHYERAARYLEKKPHPAYNEAQRIRELRNETKEILVQKKELEYKYNYIKQLYPNIEDIFDSGFNEEFFELETDENTDRSRYYLSADEYSALSESERNQLALDRYISSRKSNWQIGRDYEMYIGYMCEQRGYTVLYNGILEKLEDMGRDLIVRMGTVDHVIQCKNWAKEKTIFEKHIFQLYGTFVLYKMDHPLFDCKAVFVTTTSLSRKARKIADFLGIVVYENINISNFPRIKCNINKQTGEKIYHLPFDQQYDRTVIETNTGEFYAMTVAEAEEKGFRRAFKHIGVN